MSGAKQFASLRLSTTLFSLSVAINSVASQQSDMTVLENDYMYNVRARTAENSTSAISDQLSSFSEPKPQRRTDQSQTHISDANFYSAPSRTRLFKTKQTNRC